MNRRSFLSGLVATTGLGAASGCLGGGGAGGGDGNGDGGGTDTPTDTLTDAPTDTRSETPPGSPDGTPSSTTGTPGSAPTLTDRSLERAGDCEAGDAGTASVSFGADAVTCTGCITGKDGCQQATLESAEYDPGADRLTVVVTTAGGDTPESCTQQIVHRSYEATLAFEGGLPNEVSVVHDSMGERTEVVRTTRE